MNLDNLVPNLPAKKSAVYTFEEGAVVRHPHALLFQDVARARDTLHRWGVKAGSRVGIYAPNSYHWLVHDLALIDIGAISVPFTDDFAGQIDDALLSRYNIALLLISKKSPRTFPDRPRHVALIDGENGDVQALEKPPSDENDETDQLSLVFSSGSAGGLKGLVISRKGVEETLPPIIEAIDINRNDRLMLFLPMSNFQQRNMCYAALWHDFDVIITDYVNLFDAMKALHPTVLIAPPLLYQMVHAEFSHHPGWKQSLWRALGAALSIVPNATLRRAIARRLFRDFYAHFGNKMRTLVTGMAPIRRNIGDFFDRMQLPLCETYGMMEAGSLTYRAKGSRNYGSVGKLLKGVDVRIEDGDEIIVYRQNPLTLRYFQCSEGENEQTFIEKGRIATGDIGRFDKGGNLYLLGRKKELLVTAGGYKFHPEALEEELNNCPHVAQSVFFLRPAALHLTCVVALNPAVRDDTRADVEKYVREMASIRKASQFVEIIFADTPFSRENGLLRPNLKIDRKQIVARYGG